MHIYIYCRQWIEWCSWIGKHNIVLNIDYTIDGSNITFQKINEHNH